MQKTGKQSFLGVLLVSFLLLWTTAAFANIEIRPDHFHYSLSPTGPFNHSLTVCAGGTFYVQVRVEEDSSGSDVWASTHLYYRFSGGWSDLTACDNAPSPNFDIPDNQSHTEVFQVTAPMQAGGMDVRARVYNGDNCANQDDEQDHTGDPITVVAAPDATIFSEAAYVCSGTTGHTASVSSAGAGATYDWAVTGGTITSVEPYTNEITWDADQGIGTVMVWVDVTNAAGCTTGDSFEARVDPVPVCDITVDTAVCAGTAGLTASVASAGETATYTWGITNGTITGGEDTNQITWTAGAVSPVTLTIEITDDIYRCTCSGSVDVTVNPLPLGCTITAPATVNFGSTGNTASIAEGPTPNATYAWVIFVDGAPNNGLITAGQNTNQITWTAPPSFTQIDIGVTVTTDQGCICENDPPVGGGTGGVVVTGTGQPGSIPTLSEWGMIIFSLLLAGTAVVYMRRKNDMTV